MANHDLSNYVCNFCAGSAAAPSIYFGAPGTGVYGSATTVEFTVASARVAGVSATAMDVPAGSAAAPSINFGTAATGIYGSGTMVSITTAGNNRATIDSSGISVNGIIQTTQSGASASFRCYTYRNSSTQSAYYLYSARGSIGSPANLQANDSNGSVEFRAWQTGTTFVSNGVVRFLATEAHSATALGCKLQVYVTPNTTTSPGLALEVGQDKSITGYGALKCTTGFAAWDGTPPGSKPAITGDISSYNETTFKSVLTALAGCGLMTDSTTT